MFTCNMSLPHTSSRLMPEKWVAVVILLLCFTVVTSWERRCPFYIDDVWKQRDQQCDEGKKYHCFEDELGHLFSDGCYKEKQCLKGAHPVVEGNHIRCVYCKSGYQPIEPLYSSIFTFSYCHHHSRPCKPEYGESLCRQPTKEMDIACTCNASLGFFPKLEGQNCTCFTLNDVCSGCSFRYCPNGSLKNDRGFCEPVRSIISTTSLTTNLVTTTPSDLMPVPTDNETENPDNESEDWKIIQAIIMPILFIIAIAVIIRIICWCMKIGIFKNCRDRDKHMVYFGITLKCCRWRKTRLSKNANTDLDTEAAKILTEDKNGPSYLDTEAAKKLTEDKNGPSSPSAGNDRTDKGHSGDIEKQLIVRNGNVYIEVGTMNMTMGLHSTINMGTVKHVSTDPKQSTTDPVDPSTPPPSMPDPSAPPPSMPDPSAPPPSMPDPSAPLPSIPEMDISQPYQEERQPCDDGEETLRKVPLSFQCGETEDKGKKTEDKGKKVASPPERQPCDDGEETLRKVPLSFQCGEMEDKGKKVASPPERQPHDDGEETLRKVPLLFQSGETEEEGKKVTSSGKLWQPFNNGETSLKVPVSLQGDEVEVKTALLPHSVIRPYADISPETTEPEKEALLRVLYTPSTNDDFHLHQKIKT